MKKFFFQLALLSLFILNGCENGESLESQDEVNKSQEVVTVDEKQDEKNSKPSSVVVSGDYYLWAPFRGLSPIFCFTTDESSTELLAKTQGFDSARILEFKKPAFCFNNEEEAEKLLSIKEGQPSCPKGKATLEISEYMVDEREAEVTDTAKLEKLLELEPAENCEGAYYFSNEFIKKFVKKEYPSCSEPVFCDDIARVDCFSEVDGPLEYLNGKGESIVVCGGDSDYFEMHPEETPPVCPPVVWEECQAKKTVEIE